MDGAGDAARLGHDLGTAVRGESLAQPFSDAVSEATMEPGVRILNIADEHTYDNDGKPQTKIRVTFKVNDHGPFIEYFDKATYDSYAVENKIDDFARGVKRLAPPA